MVSSRYSLERYLGHLLHTFSRVYHHTLPLILFSLLLVREVVKKPPRTTKQSLIYIFAFLRPPSNYIWVFDSWSVRTLVLRYALLLRLRNLVFEGPISIVDAEMQDCSFSSN